MPSAGLSNGYHLEGKPPAIDSSLLPSAQSPDLELVYADTFEYTQTSYLNADEWRGPLTIDQYIDREFHLQDQDLTRDNQITCWILTSSKIPRNEDGTRPILASCETLLTSGYVARGGNVSKVLAHGIGSVYTRPEHRGKGYAGRMMKELGKRLETWQQKTKEDGAFSVLYSDIGQNFYSKFGWKAFPSTHIHLPPVNADDHAKIQQDLPAVTDLEASDLAKIPTTEYLETRLETLSKQSPKTTLAAIRPDIEHFSWHHAREEFLAKVFGLNYPSIKGAIHKQTGVAVVWCRIYPAKAEDRQLHILHTIIPPHLEGSSEAQQALAALFLRAQLEAHESKLPSGVEIWDPSDFVISAAQQLQGSEKGEIEVISRDKEHVCSLRWAGGSDEQVDWVANEKFGWC